MGSLFEVLRLIIHHVFIVLDIRDFKFLFHFRFAVVTSPMSFTTSLVWIKLIPKLRRASLAYLVPKANSVTDRDPQQLLEFNYFLRKATNQLIEFSAFNQSIS